MTSHPCFRKLLIASLVTVGFLALLGAVATAEKDKPHEADSPADSPAQVAALRGEVAALRHRVEQLEKAKPADAGQRRIVDPGERAHLLAETGQIIAHFNDGKTHAWKQAHGKIRSLRVEVTAALPAEARTRIAQFNAATSDSRKSAKDQVCRLAREAVDRLASIQDSHTRAARLDEAIAVRDLIRRLAESAGRQL